MSVTDCRVTILDDDDKSFSTPVVYKNYDNIDTIHIYT